MKNKVFINLGLALLMAVFLASCFDNSLDVPDQENTEAIEMQLLQNYLDTLNMSYDVDTTELGVYYIVIEEGEGDYPKDGDTLTVGYTGYLINGFLFDSSDIYYDDGKWEFVVGDSTIIEGWNNGIKNINEGGLIQLIVPSKLAYGSEGHFNVGPYETLIFVVELFDMKPTE